MNEISARRLGGFLALVIAIVVGTLVFAMAVAGPTPSISDPSAPVASDRPSLPAESFAVPAPSPTVKASILRSSPRPEPQASLPSALSGG